MCYAEQALHRNNTDTDTDKVFVLFESWFIIGPALFHLLENIKYLILIVLYPYTYCNEKRLIPSTSVDPNQTSPVGAI